MEIQQTTKIPDEVKLAPELGYWLQNFNEPVREVDLEKAGLSEDPTIAQSQAQDRFDERKERFEPLLRAMGLDLVCEPIEGAGGMKVDLILEDPRAFGGFIKKCEDDIWACGDLKQLCLMVNYTIVDALLVKQELRSPSNELLRILAAMPQVCDALAVVLSEHTIRPLRHISNHLGGGYAAEYAELLALGAVNCTRGPASWHQDSYTGDYADRWEKFLETMKKLAANPKGRARFESIRNDVLEDIQRKCSLPYNVQQVHVMNAARDKAVLTPFRERLEAIA